MWFDLNLSNEKITKMVIGSNEKKREKMKVYWKQSDVRKKLIW